MGFGELRAQSYRFAQSGNPVLRLFRLNKQITETAVDLGKIRFEPDCFTVLGDRLIEFFLRCKFLAERRVREVALWPQRHCFGEGPGRLCVVGFRYAF